MNVTLELIIKPKTEIRVKWRRREDTINKKWAEIKKTKEDKEEGEKEEEKGIDEEKEKQEKKNEEENKKIKRKYVNCVSESTNAFRRAE